MYFKFVVLVSRRFLNVLKLCVDLEFSPNLIKTALMSLNFLNLFNYSISRVRHPLPPNY